jgi:iron complex outermembrane receptor protein
MAVSAFSERQLRAAQVNNIVDLERMTPNLTLTETGGLQAGSVAVFMRGIGNDPGFDQGVGIYVDDVYLNRTSGALLEVYDTERVEILKGPQGNLYGRNTIGGAIKYISRTPSDEFEGGIEVKGGNYDLIEVKANASGPLIENTLYGSVGALYKDRDGIQDNTFDGGEYWNTDVQAFRGSLLWQATDSLSFKLAGDYMKDDSDPRVPNRVGVDPATLGGIDFVISGANLFLGPGTGLVSTPNDQSLPDDIDTISTEYVDGFDEFEIEATTLALTVDWDMSDSWTVKSVTALRTVDDVIPYDFDGSEQQFITTKNEREQEDFSQEFQFNYTGDTVNAVMGLYYLDGSQEAPGITFQYPRLRAILTQFKDTYVDDRDLTSYSAYASVDWNFAESWQLSLGGRYTRDEKDETQRATVSQGLFAYAGLAGFPPQAIVSVAPGQEAIAQQSPLFAFWASSFVPPGFNSEFTEISFPEDTDASEEWNEFTPSARLTYFATEDLMFYGGYSSGFKSGGFQRTGGLSTSYDPETVDTYSLGMKSTSMDGTLKLNIEAFFNDYTDKQLSTIVLQGGDLTETVGNVGELETSGIEAEITWLPPVDGLVLGLNVGYLDTDVKKYKSGDQDIADQTAIGFAPKWTAQGRIHWDIDVADYGYLTVGTDLSYRDESYTNSPVDLTSEFAPLQVQEEHVIWNAMLAFTTADERWRIAVEGKNLDDERVVTNTFVVGPFVTAGYNMPRTWAVSLGYQF